MSLAVPGPSGQKQLGQHCPPRAPCYSTAHRAMALKGLKTTELVCIGFKKGAERDHILTEESGGSALHPGGRRRDSGGAAVIHEPRPVEKGPLLSVEKCGEFGLVDCKEQDGF